MGALDLPSRLAAALLPRVWSRVPGAGRVLYLTFDDGPSLATEGVLDVLEAHGAHASFFVLGEHLRTHPALCRRLAEGGHAVGSHGWHHADPWRTWQPGRWRLGDAAVAEAFGRPPRWQRPPYGHLTASLWRHAALHRQHVALWDTMPGDFLADRPAERIVTACRRAARPGAILVLHDGLAMQGRIEPIAARLVPALLADGWHLAPLPDDPRHPASGTGRPQPGGSG